MNILKLLFGSKKKHHKDHISCDFGKKDFHLSKRDKKFVDDLNQQSLEASRLRPIKKTSTTTTTTTKVQSSTTTTTTTKVQSSTTTTTTTTKIGVILVDFDGQKVTTPYWNSGQPLDCLYSGLTIDEQSMVMNSVLTDFADFNVIVTTDESLYNSAPANKRTRCIVTETWEWYGKAGGVSFIGTFTWGNDVPCFVFSSLLGYNVKNIAEAISHEVGHTLGLNHQSTYDASCVKTAEYNPGCCGEAPIMGVSYYQPVGKWWVGPCSAGCTVIQDDYQIIKNLIGLK